MPEMKFFPENIHKTTHDKKEKNNDLILKYSQEEDKGPQNPFSDLSENDVFLYPQDDV